MRIRTLAVMGVCLICYLILCRSVLVSAAEWGDLSGTFIYDGKAPEPRRMQITKDLETCEKFADEIVEQGLLVGEGGGLSNVFVYLKVAKGTKLTIHPDIEQAATAEPVVLDNRHCMFAPHALGLWAGKQTLLVKNSDPIGQAVKIDPVKNQAVNSILPVGGQVEQKFQFGENLPSPIACGIHPWESAWILIHDSPYFAVTAKDGSFTIKNLPVGEWEFRVWQEKVGYLNAKSDWKKGIFKMKIKAGANDLGTIKVAPSLFKK